MHLQFNNNEGVEKQKSTEERIFKNTNKVSEQQVILSPMNYYTGILNDWRLAC